MQGKYFFLSLLYLHIWDDACSLNLLWLSFHDLYKSIYYAIHLNLYNTCISIISQKNWKEKFKIIKIKPLQSSCLISLTASLLPIPHPLLTHPSHHLPLLFLLFYSSHPDLLATLQTQQTPSPITAFAFTISLLGTLSLRYMRGSHPHFTQVSTQILPFQRCLP